MPVEYHSVFIAGRSYKHTFTCLYNGRVYVDSRYRKLVLGMALCMVFHLNCCCFTEIAWA